PAELLLRPRPPLRHAGRRHGRPRPSPRPREPGVSAEIMLQDAARGPARPMRSPTTPSAMGGADGPAVGETAGASRPVVQPDPLELTHRNHFRFGSVAPGEDEPRWFVPREAGDWRWTVAYGR